MATMSAVYSGSSNETFTWDWAARLYSSSGRAFSSTRRSTVASPRSP